MKKIDLHIFWLIKQLKSGTFSKLDILDAALVDAFCEEFKIEPNYMVYAANKCPQLNKALSEGYKRMEFTRCAIGINAALQGVPKWVYVYNLSQLNK